MSVPYNRRSDEIMYLFSNGPRSDEEIAILDEHIAKVSQEIKDNWTDRERETRAQRASSPCRVPATTPVVSTQHLGYP